MEITENKRITREEILAAFHETKYKPMRHDMFPAAGGACGLGALFVSQTKTYTSSKNATEFLESIYGMSYIHDFARGFDGVLVRNGHSNETAYQDGQAAWEAVKHLAQEESHEPLGK